MNNEIIPGDHVATIKAHDFVRLGAAGTAAIEFALNLDSGQDVTSVVWLEGQPDKREQTLRIARAQLKLCGFDADAEDIGAICGPEETGDPRPTYRLAGRKVPVNVYFPEGKRMPRVEIRAPRAARPPKSETDALTLGLRSVASAASKAAAAAKAPAPAPKPADWDAPTSGPSAWPQSSPIPAAAKPNPAPALPPGVPPFKPDQPDDIPFAWFIPFIVGMIGAGSAAWMA